ncbi:MAG: bifunctional 2-C-methyl-D-erythritol 4-phosphate cytidylyltransferase/2-C-methyl-D-erythritol 2,4-cyclodiphosphate synthase [Rhodospirillaceae bacterium]|nr:bifunctional 2-C-methyl-D-erythritol 4-phosphate cytidylyltransferase/2-C-methyl-D-erythritol 2,4-cyclodiphosphate synthase [Rhodospirillaceae bacterium]MBL6930366.1 bifunctional 2-C-methyl-D-erythritol 4-phosphate cytidylyltransferase/2-C-methyl-D-erythritol 2,4-cyclodiphosphate synthase [Rhodospirillales bacterium]
MSSCIALVVGAGRGHRFGSEVPKQYGHVGGYPVIWRTLAAFAGHPKITAVRAVIHPDDRNLYDAVIASGEIPNLLEPVFGGPSRQQSVCLGLESLVALNPELVLIHDAARPFVSGDTIERVIEALASSKGAIAALPVHDTLKSSAEGFVKTTVDRTGLWRAQTPQGFQFIDILEAHRSCPKNSPETELTDDAAVAEKAGMAVELVAGNPDNIKITTMDDLKLAEQNLTSMEYRTGMGFDVHRFCKGDQVTLCGVSIPHAFALDGHSDADVALHALTDALLGAIGAEDIGSHFPPGDGRWKDASSDQFLGHARNLISKQGGEIVNVDLTLICEDPKIGPHRQAMREAVATVLGIQQHRISVKATTTEQLGFTGRKEGIAAQAVATVKTARLA